MTDPRPAAVIVLAAGEGTRMRSASTPKVLHEICGRTLLGHVLATAAALQPQRLAVVVGHGREAVEATLPDHVTAVLQEQQHGTGHAVRLALQALGELDGTVVVLPGDSPLLTHESLRALVTAHEERGSTATLLTAVVPDPTGYGRVLRDDAGRVIGVVEERDATESQRSVDEIGTSTYAFDAHALLRSLDKITTDNSQGEEYLTDVIGVLVEAREPVDALTLPDHREVLGVNDRVHLAEARRLLNDRLLEAHMRSGVTVVDPASTWVDATVTIAPDTVIEPVTQLRGSTAVAAGARVGPGCTLVDTEVGSGAWVRNAVCESAVIGPDATVGPFTYLRPGTRLGRGAKAGGFVEMKSAVLGDEAKVPHLSYVGDAEIGARSNIGAATVFVNYDGEHKHLTTVGDDARVGSDTMLVAPVSIGDGAYTAAGSVITEDVPPGAMGIARARQHNVEGWVERRRPGTPAADAARRAKDEQGAGDQ